MKMNNSDNVNTFGQNLHWNNLHCNKDALTDGYGWFLQGLLAALAFSCLVAKRYFEPPHIRRPWKTWWYDTSKQGIGAAVIHFLNIYLAPLFQGDPCTWYIINFLLDSTIGLFIIYIGIRICHLLAKKKNFISINFGEYTAPNSWIHQTIIYVALMVLIKLLTTLIVQFEFWNIIKNFILSPFSNPKYELAVVILIIPFFVNIFVFWITDNFLMRYKYSKKQQKKHFTILKKKKIKLFKNYSVLQLSSNGNKEGDISNNIESKLLISDEDLINSS